MKIMNRNKTGFYYCQFLRKEAVLDKDNLETGDYRVIYDTAVQMFANISAATGNAQLEQFGNLPSYDKVIVTDNLQCPINESSVLFIDKEPTYDSNGNPLFDYTVQRVAKSLNSISIAVSKVKVS